MTTRHVLVWLLSLSGLAVLGAEMSGAGAVSLPVLPNPIYRGFAPNEPSPFSPPNLTSAGTYSKTVNDLINPLESYQFSIDLAGSPNPSVSAFVSADEVQTFASGELFYSFEVVSLAGTTSTPVKLDLTALLSATSTGTGGAGAVMQIQQVPDGDWAVCSEVGSPGVCSGEPSSLPVSTTVTVNSNTIYQVELAASADAPAPGLRFLAGQGTGIVDPHFAIDPSTPNPTNYALDFSPGIGNSSTPAVPELSSWILLSLGFAGAGLLRMSRKGLRAALTTSP